MTEAARGVFEFEYAKAAVAIVDAEQGDLLQADIGVDSAGEGVALYAIVLDGGEVPGNDGFGNGGIGGGAVDDGNFGFEGDAERDVGGISADGAEHGPDFVVVGEFHHFIAGCAPDGLIVVDHQLEGLASVGAAGVGFFDGELCSVKHGRAEALVGMVLDGAEEADSHFVYFFGL